MFSNEFQILYTISRFRAQSCSLLNIRLHAWTVLNIAFTITAVTVKVAQQTIPSGVGTGY